MLWSRQRALSGGSVQIEDGDGRERACARLGIAAVNGKPRDSELGGRFGLYVVGVFDILGQKRSLYTLPSTSTSAAIRDKEVHEYVRDTAGRALEFRSLFRNQFRQAIQTVQNIAQSQGHTERLMQMLQSSLRQWGMSDSYVVAIPPPDGKEFSMPSRLIDVYHMLDVSAAVWLLAMSRDLPIRGGIELGFAIDIGEQEVYGHALAEALRLESRVAQYPRVVVGEKLLSVLNDVVGIAALQNAQEGPLANNLAELCWKCLRKDEDGQFVVDVAGGGIAAQIRDLKPSVLSAVASNVQRQLERHEDAEDTKLVKRYEWLQRHLAQLL